MVIWLSRGFIIVVFAFALLSLHYTGWDVGRKTVARARGQAVSLWGQEVNSVWKLTSLSVCFCLCAFVLDWNVGKFLWNIHNGMSLTQAGTQPFGL